MQAAVLRAIDDKGRTIRLPVHVHEQLKRLRAAAAALAQELHRAPSYSELSERTGLPPERLREMRRLELPIASLSSPAPASAVSSRRAASGEAEVEELGDTLVAPGTEAAGPGSLPDFYAPPPASDAALLVEADLLRSDIEDLLASLLPREAYILSLRFGLADGCGGQPQSVAAVARRLGVSSANVRELEERGLLKLKSPQRSSFLRPYVVPHDGAGPASPARAGRPAPLLLEDVAARSQSAEAAVLLSKY